MYHLKWEVVGLDSLILLTLGPVPGVGGSEGHYLGVIIYKI
jgi:hypothetical protein